MYRDLRKHWVPRTLSDCCRGSSVPYQEEGQTRSPRPVSHHHHHSLVYVTFGLQHHVSHPSLTNQNTIIMEDIVRVFLCGTFIYQLLYR